MSKRDARNLSPSQLDELRSRAIALWKMGWSRRDTATLLEVHYNSVGRWVSAFELEGPGAIVSAKRGRKAGGSRSLSASQELSVQKMITDKTPDQLKMPFALWTRRAVCELVEESFGIPLPERTCGEYLKRWGFTAQRPARRNYEQNPEAVRRWMQEQYPEVAKRAKEQGAEIHWGDETGVRNDCAHGRGFSPKGKTPVANSSSKRFLVHTMFALRYANAFYKRAAGTASNYLEGLQFPEEKTPDYLDFAYFSFVVGMTCQVSDVQITSRAMRRLALIHGLLAFVFNTAILALSVNIISGLLQ